ncbi:MAG: RNA methyltransferase [Bryobacteraceae bacterium]|nr:RNA methyltransferase [Bryobacteraceae bacterium]
MIRAEAISSARNPLLREVRKAVQRGSLTAQGLCVAATFHLLEEALRSGRNVPAVIAARSSAARVEQRLRRQPGTRLLVVDDPVLAELSGTETAQGVVALVEPPSWSVDDILGGRALALVLDGVQDPGNAGALARAAEAFGASGALFLKGSTHPHHPKTLRASAGSLFRLPCCAGIDAEAAVSACVERGVRLFAAVAHGGTPVDQVDFRASCAVVIGSEAHGVGPALSAAATAVHIPTAGVESLNAAAAGAVILYEAARQRRRVRP